MLARCSSIRRELSDDEWCKSFNYAADTREYAERGSGSGAEERVPDHKALAGRLPEQRNGLAREALNNKAALPRLQEPPPRGRVAGAPVS
jgi:hypothetical protein